MARINKNCAEDSEARELRCSCKQLLARLLKKGLEFKCKRCKNIVILKWSEFQVKVLQKACTV